MHNQQEQVFLLHEQDITAHKIASLASQHHASEYSCIKFGPNGSPVRYTPLSLQAPDVFAELRSRQVSWSQTQVWWHSTVTGDSPSSPVPVVLGPSGVLPNESESVSTGLAQELSKAMEEEFPKSGDSVPCQPFPSSIPTPHSHPIKTSSSHPINISMIIPSELLALISSHLLFTSTDDSSNAGVQIPIPSSQPTVFELPAPFTLDRLITTQSKSSHSKGASSLDPSFSQAVAASTLARHLHTRSHVTEALQAALNSGIPSLPDAQSSCDLAVSSVSVSVSLVKIPPLPPPDIPVPPFDSPKLLPLDSPGLQPPSFVLGNILLSSCPGKKVRLHGPVRGRSGVCRDLDADLQRMKDLGVRCIVCCLDDTELEFLGVPWAEYERATNKLGMDVLRLPTPEGLSPSLTPADLDRELTSLIQNYTLRGIPVLVHCRGGVGRAGVIACCWIIKLGLCGWFGAESPSELLPDDHAMPSSTSSAVRPDTLQLVEKVIAVVRRRRSVKAVETYEQVKFLVDFIEYLRSEH
ncbi:phosphatases II [Dendrothele bispora CBS 962.96]|uniref:Phosphatases II n=1 Tax=Dendrothele bispora (strain CBS 962.96) TaxID=1314807 RepID=A0A4S8KVY3_DENBC|nr:phosphatases II [Dendrothele bispora CBS 962.96]